MIRTLIIDDEQHCIHTLQYLLETQHADNVKIIGSFTQWEEARTGIYNLTPDLIFLDIELNGKTSLDLLPKLGKTDFKIIFTTGHAKYAAKAFRLAAIDFLEKPVDEDELADAINRVKNSLENNDTQQKLSALLKATEKLEGGSMALPLKDGDSAIVRIADIIRCEANNGCIEFHVAGNKKYTLCSKSSFDEYERNLAVHNFYRIHDSHLINIKQMDGYLAKDGIIRFKDQSTIAVAERRKKDFKKRISGIF